MVKQVLQYTFVTSILLASFMVGWAYSGRTVPNNFIIAPDSLEVDTPPQPEPIEIDLPFPFQDSYNPTMGDNTSNLYLNDPESAESEIEYDHENGGYNISQNINGDNYKNPTYMSFEEYLEYDSEDAIQDYWRKKTKAEDFSRRKAYVPELEGDESLLDRILNGAKVEIRPSGSAEITLGVNYNVNKNPSYTIQQQRQFAFDFDQNIQMNVVGKVGDYIEMKVNYDTKAMLAFENKMNLKYEGQEDDIIKLIEAGNVTMPLSGTLITGSQALMGIKTQLQFGHLTITSILSKDEGEKKNLSLTGGAQTSEFNISALDYEDNRHYFLAQYFRDHYNDALKNLPFINSGISITKIEVWITNTTGAYDNTRNIVAFMDLGEKNWYRKDEVGFTGFVGEGSASHSYPDNDVNNLYDKMTSTYSGARNINNVTSVLGASSVTSLEFEAVQDFEKVSLSRKLDNSEYTFHPQLGFISLNTTLNSNQVLAVAFQFTVGDNVYQVGDFSTDISSEEALFVKMLKSTNITTELPTWDLMMKNVYALGAYQVSKDQFLLDIMYLNDESGTYLNYIPETSEEILSTTPLLRVLGLDHLNVNQEAKYDGLFDFIDGVTINASKGRIYFPVLEPFGEDIKNKFTYSELGEEYAFDKLYEETKTAAGQYPDKNKFYISGKYQSSSSNIISLQAMNIPQGSVTVTSNGKTLTENVDYTVDYTMGQVKIINEGLINSGANIDVSYESNSIIPQPKSLLGTHFDYKLSDNFNLGATILNLRERPYSQKINIGDEPINNTIWGFNTNYHTQSRFITKLIDYIPFVDTKTPTDITVSSEFAHLIPGHHKVIGDEGNAYIDDFEGSQYGIDVKNEGAWRIASTPQGQTSLFPEASLTDDLSNGFNRAKLAWYQIKTEFTYETTRPDHLTETDVEYNHYVRLIGQKEIYPERQNPNNIPTTLSVLNLAYYPKERGPYNYDAGASQYSYGIDKNGTLNAPASRWGGITREISQTNFESANIEFIEFWLMDPFFDNPNHSGGKLYLNLGNVSEDVLKDGQRSFENGLPSSAIVENVDSTAWGYVSTEIELVDNFDTEEDSRQYQDVGLDGFSDEKELSYFQESFLDEIAALYGTSSKAYSLAQADPSSDNYHYFLGNDYDSDTLSVLDRYKNWNGMEGNTNTSEMDDDLNNGDFQTMATTMPNDEDINNDKNLSESESYFQYELEINPNEMEVGNNYIINKVRRDPLGDNGDSINWYQFRIPVQQPNDVIGSISDFRSIRFLRMFLRGFEDSVIMRFATLELVRGEWRRYLFDLSAPGEYIPNDDDPTTFDVSVVNYEEHGGKEPVNYVLPPGITREQNFYGQTITQMNEQSLSFKICNLEDGDARAAYKNTNIDFRSYKKLRMFIHAEAKDEEMLEYGDLTAFIRLGSDFIDNYYEYEIPLQITPPGNYNGEIDAERYDVWPILNELELELKKMYDAKQERNSMLLDPSSGISITEPYVVQDVLNKITIVGSPNLSNVKTIMIGVRNPVGGDYTAKCGEIWFNELRLSDFDERGGWAAKVNVNTQLADVANVSMAGNISTIGFGSLDQTLSERNRETTYQYDVAGSLDLSTFMPDEIPVSIPVYVGKSEIWSNPQYNPLDPDIEMKESLSLLDENGRDSLKQIAQIYQKQQSINFTNVKITKPLKFKKEKKEDADSKNKKKKGGIGTLPIDPTNFAFTYAYTEKFYRDINTDYDVINTHKGNINYGYAPKRKNYRPFKKLPLMKTLSDAVIENYKKKEKEISDEIQRLKKENNKDGDIPQLNVDLAEMQDKRNKFTTFSKKFMRSPYWQPIKDINFYLVPGNITFQNSLDRYFQENLRRNTSSADLLIYPTFNKTFNWKRTYNVKYDLTTAFKLNYAATNDSRIDEPEGRIDTDVEKDSVLTALKNFGRNLQYHHTISANYTLPINKIPLTDWIKSTAQYSANYDWIAAPPAIDSLGNSIQNSNTKQLNTTFNLVGLYQKVGYFKKVENKFGKRGRSRQNVKPNKEKDEPENENDSTETKKKKVRLYTPFDVATRILMGVRNVSFNYSETNGTFLPGYMPGSNYFGMDVDRKSPGIPFILGSQDDIRPAAIANQWITTDTLLNSLYYTTYTQNMGFKGTIEPLPDLKINLNADKNYTFNHSEYFRSDSDGNYNSYSKTDAGSFSISFFSWGTAFEKQDSSNSKTFNNFKLYTQEIADRMAQQNPNYAGGIDSAGYPEGYGMTSQFVMIPAFIAAYSGQDPASANLLLNPFPKIPMPNWSLTFTGLTKLDFIKKYFSKVSISHAYKSTYSVNAFNTNLMFADSNGFPNSFDATGNFIAEHQITDVSLSESLSPIIGINATMNNSMSVKLEAKRTRSIGLSLSNNQLNEVLATELVVGTGYKIKNLVIPYKIQGIKKKAKSDLDIKVNFSIKDNKTVLRKVLEDITQVSAGTKVYSFDATGDYAISKRVNARAFIKYQSTKPFVLTSYPNSVTSVGITLRFSLAQ